MSCSICYEKTDSPFKTSCNHLFCNHCITNWLMIKNTCPVCRHTLIESIEDSEDEDEDIFDGEISEKYSHNIRKVDISNIHNYEDDIDDQIDLFYNAIVSNNLQEYDIKYHEHSNYFDMLDRIRQKHRTINIDYIYYPETHTIEVFFDIIYNMPYPKEHNKCKFINHRGKIFNKIIFIV